MRSKIFMAAGSLVFLVAALIEIASVLDILRQLVGTKLSALSSPTANLLLMLAGLIVFAAAFVDHKIEARKSSKSDQPTPRGEAPTTPEPAPQSHPVNTFTIQSGAIHNYSGQALPSPRESTTKDAPRYNIKFLGLRSIKTPDLRGQASLSEDGFLAIKAGFLNKSIPDIKVDDYDYVRARVVIYDKEGVEVFSTSKPVWLNHEQNDNIHLDVNSPEYLLLAVFGNDDTWAVPHITMRANEYWEDGEQATIDGHSLNPRQGPFKVDITLVGKDNIGLAPVSAIFDLRLDGSVGI